MFYSILLALLPAFALGYSWNVLSKYDYFAKRPTNAIRTAGRLTSREIQYLKSAGYNSFISTVNFTTGDTTFSGMDGEFLSTADEMALASSLGMQTFAYVASMTPESVDVISDAIRTMKKPIFIHCHSGYSATLFTLLHLFKSGALTDSNIFPWGLALGFDYQASSSSLDLVNQVTGMNAALVDPSLESTFTYQEQSYKNYYWSHRMGNDSWYNVGQVLQTHVNDIQQQGYKAVISLRANGESTTRLSTDPWFGAIPNGEFSDKSGNYDVNMERAAFEAVGVKFYHLPVSGSAMWDASTFFKYLPAFQEANTEFSPILIHCASGYRSSAYVSTYLAYSQGLCTADALQMASKAGYSFDVSKDDASVVAFMESVLKC